MKSVLAFLCLVSSATAADVPAGTRFEIRIKTKVSSNASHPHDPVEAVVIKPVMAGDRFLIPYAAALRGEVESAQPSEAGRRAVLHLNFNRLEGAQGSGIRLSTRVVEVDNARESVDENGAIVGIAVSEAPSSPRVEPGGNPDILQMAKAALAKLGSAEIVYEPGVEMTLELTGPVTLSPGAIPGLAIHTQPLTLDFALEQLVNSQPSPVNLVIVGSQQQLQAALSAAGWKAAGMLNKISPRETFRDIADGGYKQASEPPLLLDGRPADFDYQKRNDTFAKRHRLRIWRQSVQWQGQDVWAAAASRTFAHESDPHSDDERAKVVSDLLGTGAVKSLTLTERKTAVLALGEAAVE